MKCGQLRRWKSSEDFFLVLQIDWVLMRAIVFDEASKLMELNLTFIEGNSDLIDGPDPAARAVCPQES